MTEGLQIKVSPRCIATKACINRAPGTFRLNDQMTSQAYNPDGETVDAIVEAAEACPTGAITVFLHGKQLA